MNRLIIYICALFVMSVIIISPAFAQTTHHFSTAFSNTGSNAIVLIQTSTSITINGSNFTLASGDEIAVYTPLSDTICCGVGTWSGSNISITVWGDNDQTATIKEGLTSGQSYTFHIWDASESKEYRFLTATFSSGNSTYSANGISIVGGLSYPSSHFRVANPITGSNSTVMIPSTVTISIEGQNFSLASNDEIAIYAPSPDTICCGTGKWTGNSLSITVWGDNDQTANIKEGFTGGQIYQFRLWDASASTEYPNFSSATFSSGNATYSVNGISVVSGLNFSTVDSLSISLSAGWNIISSNVKPADSSMSAMFNSIVSNVAIVKNNAGQVYWPEYGVNQIGNWRIIDGYMVYMKNGATLGILGARINPASTSMTLSGGWNMVAYLPNISLSPSTALASLGSTVVIVKDGSGNVYWPEYGVNQIGTMQVGKGYQIYLSSSGTLTYPASVPKEGREIVESGYQKGSLLPQHFRFMRSTGVNATLLIKSKNTENQMGEIGIFTSAGICAGAAVMNGDNMVITVWGDDRQTSTIDGFTEGEEYRFRVWDKNNNTEREISMIAESGSLVYNENGITVVSFDNSESTPKEFALEQNYPNPFNPSTTIKYQLKDQAEVTLSIYSTVGQLVRVLIYGVQPAGVYTVQWDGKNESGVDTSSGLYLCRLQAANFVQTKKMLLLK